MVITSWECLTSEMKHGLSAKKGIKCSSRMTKVWNLENGENIRVVFGEI
jgi:hypothetical protein